MKIPLLLVASALFISQPVQATSVSEEIKKVESSLQGSILFKGEKPWEIKERMQHYGVPGVSIAVIKDYKIHWVKHYGIADKETGRLVDKNTLFQAASISKPISAYGTLKLVEQNKLSLDSPVNEKLVGWQIPENKFTKQRPVALKHLLNHSAGLTVHGFDGYAIDEAVPTILQVLNGQKPANSAAIEVDLMPETQYRYSGGGYTVMQKLVVDVSKTNFPDIMNQLVLSPLAMTKSTFQQPLPAEKLKHAAAGYLPNKLPVPGKYHTYPEIAPAGLWTTAEDLAKFVIDVQLAIKSDKSQVLKQSTVIKMLTPFVSKSTGLGFFIRPDDEDAYFGHDGWNEGFSSWLMSHKTKGYGVVIMINSNHPEFITELENSVAVTYQWKNYLQPTLTSLPISRAEQQRIVGRYHFKTDMIFSIFAENDRIFMQYLNGEKIEVFRIGENQYIRRELPRKFRFEKIKGDNSVSLIFGVNNEMDYIRKRLAKDEFVPFELVLNGNMLKAESMYSNLFLDYPDYKEQAEGILLGHADKLKVNNKKPQALELYQVSSRLFSTARSFIKLADFYLQSGDKQNALDNFKKAQLIEPENPVIIKALKMLAK